MTPAVLIGAALVAVGAIAAFAIKRAPQTEHAEAGVLAACACASCWCAPPADIAETQDQDPARTKEPLLLAGA
jgi:hypothetical protein